MGQGHEPTLTISDFRLWIFDWRLACVDKSRQFPKFLHFPNQALLFQELIHSGRERHRLVEHDEMTRIVDPQQSLLRQRGKIALV